MDEKMTDETTALVNIPRAALSIAAMVDEFTQRGWNDEGRAQFAIMVQRRIRRFIPSPPDPIAEMAGDYLERMNAGETNVEMSYEDLVKILQRAAGDR